MSDAIVVMMKFVAYVASSGDPTQRASAVDPDVVVDRTYLLWLLRVRLVGDRTAGEKPDPRAQIVAAGVVASVAHLCMAFDESPLAYTNPLLLLVGSIAISYYIARLAAAVAAPAFIKDVPGEMPANRTFRPQRLLRASVFLALAMGLQGIFGTEVNQADEALQVGLIGLAFVQLLFVVAAVVGFRGGTVATVHAARLFVAVIAGADLAWFVEYMRHGEVLLAVTIGFTALGIAVAAGLVDLRDTRPEGREPQDRRRPRLSA